MQIETVNVLDASAVQIEYGEMIGRSLKSQKMKGFSQKKKKKKLKKIMEVNFNLFEVV
jgi:hypothetical protein